MVHSPCSKGDGREYFRCRQLSLGRKSQMILKLSLKKYVYKNQDFEVLETQASRCFSPQPLGRKEPRIRVQHSTRSPCRCYFTYP